ncbi:MAG: hypothetical protein ACRC8Q_10795 [Aeromonas sp.]
MMTDTAEFKRWQIRAVKATRESLSNSILDSYQIQQCSAAEAQNDEPARKPAVPCSSPLCNDGMVDGLRGASECWICGGIGYELTDPVAVVRALMAREKKLKQRCRDLQRDHDELKSLWTDKEIELRREMRHAEQHSSKFD